MSKSLRAKRYDLFRSVKYKGHIKVSNGYPLSLNKTLGLSSMDISYPSLITDNTSPNLFDYTSCKYLKGYLTITNNTIAASDVSWTFFMPCKPNTTYTVYRKRTTATGSESLGVYRVAYCESIPALDTAWCVYGMVGNASSEELVISTTTDSNAKYLCFTIRDWDRVTDKSDFVKVVEGYYPEKKTDYSLATPCANLFNYDEKFSNYSSAVADENGWFDVTLDNTSGASGSTTWRNCFTSPNLNLKTDTTYYLFVEVAEYTGNLYPIFMDNWSGNWYPQFKDRATKSGYITTKSDFTSCTTMLRTNVLCYGGNKGHIKFRIGVYENKYDAFEKRSDTLKKIPINFQSINLFNYTDMFTSVKNSADEDGYFTITIDNSTGTSTVYSTFYTNKNLNLKTSTRYYVFVEVAEKTGTINTVLVDQTNNSSDLGQFKTSVYNSSGYATTRDSFDSCKTMTRGYAYCKAGESGTIKFRVAVYEVKKDIFEPYYDKSIMIYTNDELSDSDKLFIDYDRDRVILNETDISDIQDFSNKPVFPDTDINVTTLIDCNPQINMRYYSKSK